MDLILRSELRALWWRRGSVLSTLAVVVLGVASVVSVHRLSVAVDQSLLAQTPPWLRGNSALLVAESFSPETFAGLRQSWRRGDLAGVTGLAPVLTGTLTSSVGPVTITGIDALADSYGLTSPPQSGAGDSQVEGGAGRVLASSDLPQELVIHTAAGDVHIRTVTLANLPEATLIADIGDAERWLGDRASGYAVARLSAGYGRLVAAAERLMPGISAALPEPIDQLRLSWPQGWSSVSGDAANALRQLAASIMFNLGALGTLAVVVAGFLLYQAATVARRRSALLRSRLIALGVPERRLRATFVGLGAMEGLVGGVVGTLLGLIGADALIDQRLGSELPPQDWVLIAKGVSLGVVVCLCARWLASAGSAAWALPMSVTVGLLLVSLLAWPASGLFGAFGGLLGLCVLAAALVPAVFALAAKFRPAWLPLAPRLGFAQLVRGRREMAAALTALALAVAASMSVTIMVESFRADLLRVLDLRLGSEAYLDVDARWTGQLAEGDIQDALSGADRADQVRVAGFGSLPARLGAEPVELGFRRFDAWGSRRYGLTQPLQLGEALISERMARDFNLAAGDPLQLRLGSENTTWRVKGLFPGFGDIAPLALVDVDDLAARGFPTAFDRFAIDGIDIDVVQARLSRFGAIESAGEVRRSAEEQFDRTFAITDSLTLIALLVAALGTVSAMIALRLSQQSETELLHAMGTARSTLTAAELLRGLTLGGLASALALPLGLAMAWVLCAVVNPRAFGWSVSWQPGFAEVLPPLLLCVLMAVLAAAAPMLLRVRGQARGDVE